MFLETHLMIIDYEKRYLDLEAVFPAGPGWRQFGQWEDKGDYIECFAGWTAMFGCTYHDRLSKLGLFHQGFWPDTEIREFKPCDDRPTTVSEVVMRQACQIQ
jgi:hypothetical protein